MNRLLLVSLTALLAIGCSSTGTAKVHDYSERLALVTKFAGEPVQSVRFGLPRMSHDWEPLGDTAVIVWHTRTKAFLVDLEKSDSCRDLDREITIRLNDRVNDLDVRNGYIDLRGGGWCKMIQIRPLDTVGLKKAEQLEREQKNKT